MCCVESATGRFFRLSERNTRLLPGSAREAKFSNLSANRRARRAPFDSLIGNNSKRHADARLPCQDGACAGCCLCDASHASASVVARKTLITRK